MASFLREHASAVFAIAGASIAGLLSFLTAWLVARRQLQLRIAEKLLDRRIAAHEDIIDASKELRVMHGLGGVDKNGEVIRTPEIMALSVTLDQWIARNNKRVGKWSHLLRVPLNRELNLLQDYFVNLHLRLEHARPDLYSRIGVVIRQDFIGFSTSIENLAVDFFTDDLVKLRILPPAKWHKYPKDETERRLGTTDLWKRWPEVEKLIRDSTTGPAA